MAGLRVNHPKPQSNSQGFTIVETLIVLAVAGLILMIVFQAIPVLQRNSRNHQRRQDVQTILQAVAHHELKNSGNFPIQCGVSVPPSCFNAGYFLEFSRNKMTYYTDNTSVVLRPRPASSLAIIETNAGSLNIVQVYNHRRCDRDNVGSATNAGAGFNDVVALYTIETGGGNANQCQEL